MKNYEEELLRMLEYIKTNEIELTEKDIFSIRKNITTGIKLKNDPDNNIFFDGMEIMSPGCYRIILQNIVSKKTSIQESLQYWKKAFSSS